MNSTSFFLENRIIIRPIIGVKKRHRTKLHPYPILRFLPISATSAEIMIPKIKGSMIFGLKVNI
jgi:hypothetical protein